VKSLDTNVLVPYYAQDDPQQSPVATRLFADKQPLFVTNTRNGGLGMTEGTIHADPNYSKAPCLAPPDEIIVRVIPGRAGMARCLMGMGTHLAPERDVITELDEEREREDLERMKALGG
jgi:hypothetical protein